ncbi:MAG: outer membrane lipoprotein carrier protein LolA [Tenuifilaceae bacterium]
MRSLMLFVFALLSVNLVAQESQDVPQTFWDFSSKMLEASSINATFSLTIENRQENVANTQQGEILIKGNKYLLKIMGMEVYFDGSTKWQYIGEANEVTISTSGGELGSPLDDPAGIFRDYESRFKVRFISETRVKNRTLVEMDFYPKALDSPYVSVKLRFDKVSLEPVFIRYHGKDGTSYIVNISQFKTNVPAPDGTFTFDISTRKGIEVIDLR